VRPAHPEELKDISGADAGSIGPVGFSGRIIADNRLKDANNYLKHGTNKQIFYKIYQSVDEIDITALKEVIKEAIELDKSFRKN
ncbi:MAG TPA: hypothetical protein PK987_04375, partial [Ferruginibacter sp.]|nr:hypothetical protein [Ferruginibacter sp.]